MVLSSASNFNPLQWIQQKFSPSIRKSATPDAPKQETADLVSAQEEAFVESKGLTRHKKQKASEAIPEVHKKPPALEVGVTTPLFGNVWFEMTFGLSTSTPRRTSRSRTGN